ncbi:MAG: transcription termination factor Rho [Clostridia bacterium]|nr:transcription termination factor Rho [Clostridia bacterium]
MSEQLESMSVLELRQKAKEMGVKLSAGINKQGIIERLTQALHDAQESAPEAAAEAPARPIRSAAIITDDDEETDDDDVPVLTRNPNLRPNPRPAAPVPTGAAAPSGSSLSTISAKAPAFTMEGSRAWHNPRAYQGANSYQRSAPAQNSWNSRSPQQSVGDARSYRAPMQSAHPDTRTQAPRPQSPQYVNRFGPDQSAPETEQRPANDYRPYGAQQDYSAPRETAPAQQSGYGYNQPGYGQQGFSPRDPASVNAGISEILAAGECGDGEGLLEVLPDGYGFLRTNHYLPGKQDVYISNAQIRRFGLRTGDFVTGKTRPQREADRYSAMLYITEINGGIPEEMPTRPRFEDFTPIYPKKRITLSVKKENDALSRLMDLLCPVGFGQRAMLLCTPKVDRIGLLKRLAAAISRNHAKAQLMLLLVDERPEEVTDIQESVKGEVVFSTFEEPAESQVRVVEMALERAMRMVEQKKDVVILADGLTRLARACNAIAPQNARTLNGGLASGALNKPKKFFGAARNTREGGSLTILTTVLNDPSSELDTAILQEFRSNGNMTCSLRQRGDGPLLNWEDSATIHGEWLLTEEEQALAAKLRSLLQRDGMDAVLALLKENETNEALAQAVSGLLEKEG